MPARPGTTSHEPDSGMVHLTMFGMDPARQPERHADADGALAAPCVG